jgi:sugar O-acyltransferase (sialic acid O-acetyltransferase NeuD family)
MAAPERQVVIIGAGGHGRETAEILERQFQAAGELRPLGFIDDNKDLHGRQLGNLPVLGDWSWFDGVDRTEIAVICAVGRPERCKTLAGRAVGLGLSLASAVSPQAIISPAAHLGTGLTIFPNVVINTGANISDCCILNVSVTVSHDTVVGRYSNLNPAAALAGNVSVGEGCYVGMGARVIQGIKIGNWTTVGAGAVVICDLPEKVTAVGVPARVVKG